jgi:hypothetical protein
VIERIFGRWLEYPVELQRILIRAAHIGATGIGMFSLSYLVDSNWKKALAYAIAAIFGNQVALQANLPRDWSFNDRIHDPPDPPPDPPSDPPETP